MTLAAFSIEVSLDGLAFDADHYIWDLVSAKVLGKLCGSERGVGQAGELQLVGCYAPQ